MVINLKTRLSIMLSSVTALLVVATGLIFMVNEENHLLAEEHQKVLALASSLASQCREALLLDDVYRLYNSLTDFVSLHENISSVAILDLDGKVIMANNLAEVGRQRHDATGLGARQAFVAEIFPSLKSEGTSSSDLIINPIIIGEALLGTLLVEHSHYSIELEIGKVKRRILLVGLFAALFGILLAHFLAARLTVPLRQLTLATEGIARGERDITVDIDRQDEFGALARAFQHMTSELEKTTVSRDSIHNILDSAGDAIRVIDTAKRMIWSNKAMKDLVHYEGIPGSPVYCSTLLRCNCCDGESCLLRRIEKGEQYVKLQAWVTMLDGRSIFASIIATPVVEHGVIVGIIESIQDISEWKKAEAERRLLESQFLQAQKLETIGRLASGVAHDFNNILTVIMGYTGILLRDHGANIETREKLQIIYESGEKATALTRQLLAFSRKQVLSFEVIDLRIVINQLVKMLNRLIGDDITLTIQAGAEVFPVLADASQIEQVLMNLTVNARDALPNGGEIRIKIENCSIPEDVSDVFKGKVPPGDYVRLSVMDNGGGIPEEIVTHIFEPFFTTKDKGVGTGLGLSTVHSIVQQHQGYITVNSKSGQGTTFNLYLPASKEVQSRPVALVLENLRRGNESILVVDDDETIRLVFTEMLSGLGYTIVTAGNAREALEIFPARHFDLLITDLIMPGQNGWELAQQIVDINPQIKIIFMSGYADREAAKEKYFPNNIFLQKPLTIKGILAAIASTLDSNA